MAIGFGRLSKGFLLGKVGRLSRRWLSVFLKLIER